MREAFAGITMLEVGTMTPGKYCGYLLSGWGARCLRVERPAAGDEVSTEDLLLNRGKRSIALNLRADGGREVLLRLVEGADVLMESYRPGVTERLGIDYPALRRLNEALVYCSLSGFGQDGPDRLRPAYDLLFQAETGFSHLLTPAGGLPAPPRTYLADAVSGLMAAFAIAAALHRRAATGRGGQVDLSMQESLFSLLAVSHGTLGESDLSAGAATEAWSRRPAYDIYRAADGRYLAVAAAREASCRALFEHLGRGELADEAMRPGDGAGAAAEFLRQALGGKPAAAWQAELAALDIEVAVVNSPAEAFELPQLQSRGMVVESEHPQAGRLRQIGVPGVGPDGDGLGPAPAIGADTEAVLRELDYDEAAIARLREDGAI